MMSLEQVRMNFEAVIAASKFKDSTPLGTMTINGAFSHYMEPDTDTMWLGFAMGMRAADRLSSERSKLLTVLTRVIT